MACRYSCGRLSLPGGRVPRINAACLLSERAGRVITTTGSGHSGLRVPFPSPRLAALYLCPSLRAVTPSAFTCTHCSLGRVWVPLRAFRRSPCHLDQPPVVRGIVQRPCSPVLSRERGGFSPSFSLPPTPGDRVCFRERAGRLQGTTGMHLLNWRLVGQPFPSQSRSPFVATTRRSRPYPTTPPHPMSTGEERGGFVDVADDFAVYRICLA